MATGRTFLSVEWPAYALVVASFGPYLVPQYGIMLAQLILYPCAAWGLWTLIACRRARLVRDTLHVPLVLLLLTLWATLATLFRHTDESPLHLISMFDNYAQPLLVSLVALGVMAGVPAARLPHILRNCTVLLVALLTANNCVELWAWLTGLYPERLLAPWGASAKDREAMMRTSIVMGRYMGVFQSPANAGLVYSLTVMLAVYRLKRDLNPVPWLLALATLLVGGGLPRSKSFFVGLALAVIYAPLGPRASRALLTLLAAASLLLVLSGPLRLEHYTPQALLMERLTDTRGDLLSSVSAGRYGEGNITITKLWPRIVASPWSGYGLAGAQFGALDSEVLAHLIVGGFPALAGYVTLIAIPLVVGARALRHNPLDGWLAILLSLFMVFGGLGRPVLLANGVVLLVVLVIMLTLALCVESQEACAAQPPNSRGLP